MKAQLLALVVGQVACGVVQEAPASHISFYPDNHTHLPDNTANQIDDAWAYVAKHAARPECDAELAASRAAENRDELLVEVQMGFVQCTGQSESGLCWGVSYTDAHFSKVTLTPDGIVHALSHEMYHHWLFWAHGDEDRTHTNPCWNDIEAFSFTGNNF